MVTPWTSTPDDTSGTTGGHAVSWATSWCSGCESNGNTGPTPADSRRPASCSRCNSRRTRCDRCRSCRHWRSTATWPPMSNSWCELSSKPIQSFPNVLIQCFDVWCEQWRDGLSARRHRVWLSLTGRRLWMSASTVCFDRIRWLNTWLSQTSNTIKRLADCDR